MSVITCKGGYSTPQIQCPELFIGPVKSGVEKHSSFSILMHLEHEYCNACCLYCCCSPLPHGGNQSTLYGKYEADYPKMIGKIKSSPLFVKDDKKPHFDLWGGEPLFNLKALKELVKVLRKEWPECTLTVSTNGILLANKSIVDWIIKNRIDIQLSHDGYGQWIRTGEFDPLEDKRCLDGLRRIDKEHLFNAVNCTLSYYNYSWFKNMLYFTKHLKDNGIDNIGYIKLNHISDSDYKIDKINTKGRWQDGIDESLIGTPIGDMSLRGRILDDYLNEFFQLAVMYRDPTLKADRWFNAFKNYIMEQSKRYRKIKLNPDGSEAESVSCCRSYQSYVHNIEGNVKRDHTFVINTLGEYCECNLCENVHAPGNPMLDKCKTCKYKDQSECHTCGSMPLRQDCEYHYKWCQTLEKINNLDKLINNILSVERKKKCGSGNKCDCKKGTVKGEGLNGAVKAEEPSEEVHKDC